MLQHLRRFADQYLLQPWWDSFALERVADSLGEPDLLFAFMKRCFRYRPDQSMHRVEEYWQSPMHTWTTRQGDCEDWALFAHHIFERRRMRAQLFCVFTPDEGHAVCLVRYRRFYWTICNRGLRRVVATAHARSDDDQKALAKVAADAIYPMKWDCCAFVEDLQITELADDGTPWRYEPVLRWIFEPPENGVQQDISR